MNLQATTLRSAGHAADAPRPSGGAAGQGHFAGLLDAQTQRLGAAYKGSAFDVPEAARNHAPRREAAKADEPKRPAESKPPAASEREGPSRSTRKAATRTDEDACTAAQARRSETQGPDETLAAEAVLTAEADASLATGVEATDAADTTETTDTAATVPLLDWLTRAVRGAGAHAAPGDAAAGVTDATGADALGKTARAGAATLQDAAALLPGGAPADAAEPVLTDPRAEAALLVTAARPAAAGDAAPVTPPPGTPVAALAGAAPTGASTGTAASATPVLQSGIATPLQSPDFSAALAARLTTLARDGVQQAQLQLNPAEMGPIAVQIVVDGSRAQIDFHAAHAATRDALAAGLPALAAALDAAGLTLGGGGVFEQRSGTGEGTAGGSGTQGGSLAGEGGEPDARPAALPEARGLLDLYA